MSANNTEVRAQTAPATASPAKKGNKANNNNSNTLQAHDAEFTTVVTVPMHAVHHLPPNHKEIARLVLCRKYDPRNPHGSCAMGHHCKFVHLDMYDPEAVVEGIHVNYAYRCLEEVRSERLPAGETLAVMAPNNRAPCQLVPSEMVLKTKGSMQRHSTSSGGKAGGQPLSYCAHFYYNRMCNRGEKCGFIHGVYIDENAADNQKAPPRSGSSYSTITNTPPSQKVISGAPAAVGAGSTPPGAALPSLHVLPEVQDKVSTSSSVLSEDSHDLSDGTPRSDSDRCANSSQVSYQNLSASQYPYQGAPPQEGGRFRRNPYSLVVTTVMVA